MTVSHRRPGACGVRRWLLLGFAGALIVLSLGPLYDAWVVNQAGILVNRVMADAAPTDPAADADEAMALMEAAILRGPDTSSRLTPMWRTYGAAASRAPSEHAFTMLFYAGLQGRLDRLGQLWLGEVAAATDHWEEAAQAYQRIDASNILISRGDAYLEKGDKNRAFYEYSLANTSLDGVLEREAARRLLQGGDGDSLTDALMTSTAERVTAFYRIGRGLLAAGRPVQAVPVLERALELASVASPGAVMQQALDLNLALALAQTLPEPSTDPSSTQELARIRALVDEAVASNLTAPVCVQAARVLLAIADEYRAVSLLEEALQLDPLLPDAYLALGAWYEGKGLQVHSFDLYQEGCRQLPDDLQIAAARAIAGYRVLAPADALPLLEAVAVTECADPYLFACLGDCYRDLNRLWEARSAYEEGLRRSPGAEPLVARLAVLRQGPEEAL